MGASMRMQVGKQRGCFLLFAVLAVAISTYVQQVSSLPIDVDQWPSFPRRNIAALARGGYLKSSAANNFKRSISTLAKNGQLPTFRSPYIDTDKQEPEDEESQEKRSIASIARLRSYSAMKRNIQALARDGYPVGRGQYNQQNDKRNIAALARNGMIHKKDVNGEEYYYPFYQNPIPPLSEIDGPYDMNEMYDYQQSVNPDMFPPLSQVYKRSAFGVPQNEYYDRKDFDNWYLKSRSVGMPVHGLYRPMYVEPTSRTKRYILSLPDEVNTNDIHVPENGDNENEDKRSVGNIPMTRISELGNISLIPKLSQSPIQTTPTYRRRQYLLTRTRPVGSSTGR